MRFLTTVLLLVLLGISSVEAHGSCVLCVAFLGIVEQVALEQNAPLSRVFNNICSDLAAHSQKLQLLCDTFVNGALLPVEEDFASGLPPEHSCYVTLDMCKNEPNCTLFQQWPPANLISSRHLEPMYQPSKYLHPLTGESVREFFTDETSLHAILSLLPLLGVRLSRHARVATAPLLPVAVDRSSDLPVADHKPLVDLDKDDFSPDVRLRGSDWRGKDCDDLDGTTYPGRRVNSHTFSPHKDYNCNGINGTDPRGRDYENLFCANSGQRGIIAIGDSATAHFRIPPDWFNASAIVEYGNATFSGFLPLLEDEIDWPQCSWSTGHAPDDECPPSPLPVNSLYTRLRERNLCNHRDYQNLGVNGAATTDVQPPNGTIISMKSRNGTDQPALVIYALVGNDVCNHGPGYDGMTQPDVFYNAVVNAVMVGHAHLFSLWLTHITRKTLVPRCTSRTAFQSCLYGSRRWPRALQYHALSVTPDRCHIHAILRLSELLEHIPLLGLDELG